MQSEREGAFSWTVGGPSGSSPVSINTGGDARVLEEELKKWGTEVWREVDLFHSQQASKRPRNSLSSCCRSLLRRPQAPRCQRQSVQVFQSTVLSSGTGQAQVLQLLQGRFAAEFQQDGRAWDSDRGSSAARRRLQHRTCEFARLACCIGSGGKDVSVDRRRSKPINTTNRYTACRYRTLDNMKA